MHANSISSTSLPGHGNNNANNIAQLQREYRNMEMNRKVYADESHQVMRRQQAVIEKLKKENEEMKEGIILATRHFNETNAVQQQSQLASLQEQVDAYQRKNAIEAKKVETLISQIKTLKHKVLHQKKYMGGVNAAKENQLMVNKQIRILENRLDKSLTKFNEALAQNKVLREDIDNLRRERVVFDTIYKKLDKEHNEKKKQMAATIELSNLAYEQRDAAQVELRTLQEANRADMEHYRQLNATLVEKLDVSKRLMDEQRRQNKSAESGQVGEMTLEDEAEMKKKLHKGIWNEAKEKLNVQVSVERVQNFEEAFQKIKAATQHNDLEELVASFIQKEDQNFSLFNFVNEQTNEIAKLEEGLSELRLKEEKYGDDHGDEAGQHKQLLRDLESKLLVTEQSAEIFESKCEDAQKIVTAVKCGIQSLFNKLECNTQLMVELLGDSVVTEANMLQYLGVIEQRSNEVLQQYANIVVQQKIKKPNVSPSAVTYDEEVAFSAMATGEMIEADKDTATISQSKAAATLHSVLGIGPLTPMGQEQLHIDPPKLEDYSSEDEESGENEDSMHPLTRDELKFRTLKGLRRMNLHSQVLPLHGVVTSNQAIPKDPQKTGPTTVGSIAKVKH